MSVNSDNKRMIKGIIIGTLIGAACCAVLLCLSALAINMISGIPYGALDWITAAIAGISVLVGAYIAAAISKSRGLPTGIICAVIFMLILYVAGFCNTNGSVSVITAVKTAVALICGALGGIWGVNRKEKLHIK